MSADVVSDLHLGQVEAECQAVETAHKKELYAGLALGILFLALLIAMFVFQPPREWWPNGVLIGGPCLALSAVDRKSTRLNSSHLGISYAVFCLKKKKK